MGLTQEIAMTKIMFIGDPAAVHRRSRDIRSVGVCKQLFRDRKTCKRCGRGERCTYGIDLRNWASPKNKHTECDLRNQEVSRKKYGIGLSLKKLKFRIFSGQKR